MTEPAAVNPFTVEITWSPYQNYGRVSTHHRMVPLFAIAGAIRGGDTLEEIADDYDLTVEQVAVIAHLAGEVGEWT